MKNIYIMLLVHHFKIKTQNGSSFLWKNLVVKELRPIYSHWISSFFHLLYELSLFSTLSQPFNFFISVTNEN